MSDYFARSAILPLRGFYCIKHLTSGIKYHNNATIVNNLTSELLQKVAYMQLQSAVMDGQRWAIEAVLGIGNRILVTTDDDKSYKMQLEVTHVNAIKDNNN